MTMFLFKCTQRKMQSFKQWIFVLYIVLLTIIEFSCSVDGLSTANERGMYSICIISSFSTFSTFFSAPIFYF